MTASTAITAVFIVSLLALVYGIYADRKADRKRAQEDTGTSTENGPGGTRLDAFESQER